MTNRETYLPRLLIGTKSPQINALEQIFIGKVEQLLAGFAPDHDHFRPTRYEVINVIEILSLARDRTENRRPLFLITRYCAKAGRCNHPFRESPLHPLMAHA
jgi:hypothetical protein